ncbi:type II secretion system F family protein [Pseudokineococcus sp. 1T1Z-3]|uniref:type II secretion system F family protein n=1 Tax=Pseudokineococcus sp. 1T1Z-3 TaxID=3132745 RepID=UPI0030A0A119
MSVVVGLLVLLAALLARPPRHRRLERLLAPSPSARRSGRRRSGRRAPGRAAPLDAALLLDLAAAALEAGAAPTAAVEVAACALAAAQPSGQDEELRRRCALLRLGAAEEEAWLGVSPTLEPLRAPLALALRAGAPGAGLLRDAARELRRRRSREAQRRAQALGVRLVVPLGACALPAFAAVGVLPVVLALATDVLGG